MRYLYITIFAISNLFFESCQGSSTTVKTDTSLTPTTIVDTKGLLYKGISRNDGSILLCGTSAYTSDNAAVDKDGLLMNSGKAGIIWSKSYGISGSDEGISFVTTAKNDNILALGYQKQEQNNPLIVYMLDPTGNIIWSQSSVNCNGLENPQAVQLKDESILVVAKNAHPDPFLSNALNILKFDVNGTLLWSKQIPMIMSVIKLVYSNDVIKVLSKQKGVYIDSKVNEKYYNFPLLTLSADGDLIAANNLLLVKAPNSTVELFDAYETNNGNLYVGGYTYNDLSPNKAMSILAFTPLLEKKWAKRYDVAQESMIKSIDFDGTDHLVCWGDGYGKGDQFYFLRLNAEDGRITAASSFPQSNTRQVRSVVSKGDDYWLCWDHTNQFAWAGTNKNGSLATAQQTVSPKPIDIAIVSKPAVWKIENNTFVATPVNFKVQAQPLKSTNK